MIMVRYLFSNGFAVVLLLVFFVASFATAPGASKMGVAAATISASRANSNAVSTFDVDDDDDAKHAAVSMIRLSRPAASFSSPTSSSTSTSSSTTTNESITGNRVLQSAEDSCTFGYVDCVNGNTEIFSKVGSTTVTCAAACGIHCCVGSQACDLATAMICRDGSCSGDLACNGAGHEGQKIEYIVNSCKGEGACLSVGAEQGTVGYIKDSCIGQYACVGVGAEGGNVGYIENSCNDYAACYKAANRNGTIGRIENSCQGINACNSAGCDGGSIGYISEQSCVGMMACFSAGSQQSRTVSYLQDSCRGSTTCYELTVDGDVGFLLGSCNGDTACLYGSNMGNMTMSCNAPEACYDIDLLVGGTSVSSSSMNLLNCCNAASECTAATNATLPATCSPMVATTQVRELVVLPVPFFGENSHQPRHVVVSSIPFVMLSPPPPRRLNLYCAQLSVVGRPPSSIPPTTPLLRPCGC